MDADDLVYLRNIAKTAHVNGKRLFIYGQPHLEVWSLAESNSYKVELEIATTNPVTYPARKRGRYCGWKDRVRAMFHQRKSS